MPGVFRTVGHPVAVKAIRSMLAGHAPHAVLLAGPPAVGKTTLALDLAAGLLCTGATGEDRPCRDCRSCRLVEHGDHADLHRLAPGGAGAQIGIGGKDVRGIRDLVSELALLPVEGGWRVALIEGAHRMNDDAQSALLKTLEEPPSRTTLILCADDEDRLLPTVRSRCRIVRLGPVAVRDVEALLVGRGLGDAPTGARLARLTAGRTGLAVAYASAPEAETIRTEIVRTLLDLTDAPDADRLVTGRALLGRAAALGAALTPPPVDSVPVVRRGRGAATSPAPVAAPAEAAGPDAPSPADEDAGGVKVPAAERRRALALLLELWRDLARDLAVVGTADGASSVRETRLLEELERVAAGLPAGAAADAVVRLVRASELLDANVSPELLVDVLAIRWPRAPRAGVA